MTVLVSLASIVLLAWWMRVAWRRPDPRHELIFDVLAHGMAVSGFFEHESANPNPDARELLPSATR